MCACARPRAPQQDSRVKHSQTVPAHVFCNLFPRTLRLSRQRLILFPHSPSILRVCVYIYTFMCTYIHIYTARCTEQQFETLYLFLRAVPSDLNLRAPPSPSSLRLPLWPNEHVFSSAAEVPRDWLSIHHRKTFHCTSPFTALSPGCNVPACVDRFTWASCVYAHAHAQNARGARLQSQFASCSRLVANRQRPTSVRFARPPPDAH